MRKLFFIWLLLIGWQLHAEEMVFTVSSRSSVEVSGNVPEGVTATFDQSGSGTKGQMTTGNYTRLRIMGLNRVCLKQMVLAMHSNQSAGAGYLTMSVGGNEVWNISESGFNSENWAGAYSKTNVDIAHTFAQGTNVGSSEVVELTITATVNSLFVSEYRLTYENLPPEVCTVGFATNVEEEIAPIVESGVGQGVLLPAVSYSDSMWHFVGWSESPITQQEDIPAFLQAQSVYYPTHNCTLYAVYSNCVDYEGLEQTTQYESGTYLIASSLFNCVATGSVQKSGSVATEEMPLREVDDDWYAIDTNRVNPNSVYEVRFHTDSLATIYHYVSGKSIGWPDKSDTRYDTLETPWNYRTYEDNTILFYHSYDSEVRAFTAWLKELWSGTNDEFQFRIYGDLDSSRPNANRLIPVVVLEHTYYTSYPQGAGVENAHIESLMMIDGVLLNSHNERWMLYSIDGQLIEQTTTNINMRQWERSVYLLKTPVGCYKLRL